MNIINLSLWLFIAGQSIMVHYCRALAASSENCRETSPNYVARWYSPFSVPSASHAHRHRATYASIFSSRPVTLPYDITYVSHHKDRVKYVWWRRENGRIEINVVKLAPHSGECTLDLSLALYWPRIVSRRLLGGDLRDKGGPWWRSPQKYPEEKEHRQY